MCNGGITANQLTLLLFIRRLCFFSPFCHVLFSYREINHMSSGDAVRFPRSIYIAICIKIWFLFPRLLCNDLNFLIPLIVIETFTNQWTNRYGWSFPLIFAVVYYQSYNNIPKYTYFIDLIVHSIYNSIAEWWWVGVDKIARKIENIF